MAAVRGYLPFSPRSPSLSPDTSRKVPLLNTRVAALALPICMCEYKRERGVRSPSPLPPGCSQSRFRAPRLLLVSAVPRKVKGREVHLRLLALSLSFLLILGTHTQAPLPSLSICLLCSFSRPLSLSLVLFHFFYLYVFLFRSSFCKFFHPFTRPRSFQDRFLKWYFTI